VILKPSLNCGFTQAILPVYLFGDFIAKTFIKWLFARPLAILLGIIGVLALIWTIFNYQNISTVYLLGKYLVLLGVGIYAYPYIEKLVGKNAKGGVKTIISLLMVFVLLYILRQVFFLAVLILIVGFFVKSD
jgi:hypothetical protein